MIMAVISVRIPDNEYKYVEQFAKFNGINLSEYLRTLIKEKIEDFEDMQMVKEVEKDMIENPEDYKNGMLFEDFIKEFENEKI